MPENEICTCDRCGKLCRVSGETTPNGQPIRKSLVPKGCCVDCAITCFCKTGPLASVMGGTWSAPGFEIGQALRLPHVQQRFAAVFRAGNIGCASEEIDWERVIENWELPEPEGWDWGGDLYKTGPRRARKRGG